MDVLNPAQRHKAMKRIKAKDTSIEDFFFFFFFPREGLGSSIKAKTFKRKKSRILD